MVSSLPTAQCSPGRTGGGRGSHKPHHVQHRGRWGSSTLPLRPCLLLAAGWEGRGQGAALPHWCHTLQDGERPRSLAVPQRRGEEMKKCPGPSRRTPSRLREPSCPPHGHSGGTFPSTPHLRCCKHSPRCPAAWSRQGRGNTGDGCRTGTRGCRPQPPENPQQQEKPRSTVETLQARWAPGVQAGVQAGASHSPSLADIAIHRSVRSQWAVSSSGARMGSAPSGTGTQAEEKCNHSHAP